MRRKKSEKKQGQILVEGKQLENALGRSFYFLSPISFFFLPFYIKIWFLLVTAGGVGSMDAADGVKNILVVCGNQIFSFFKDTCPLFFWYAPIFFSAVLAVSVWVSLLLSVSVPLSGDANFWLPVNGDSCSGLAVPSLHLFHCFSYCSRPFSTFSNQVKDFVPFFKRCLIFCNQSWLYLFNNNASY